MKGPAPEVSMRIMIVSLLLAVFALPACIEEKAQEREKVDAYCYMMDACGQIAYRTCYDAATASLAATLYDQCRGARELQFDCLGRLDCDEYLLWSESDPETDLVYPCRDQDQLEAVACQNE
jgi:hypothetical protein